MYMFIEKESNIYLPEKNTPLQIGTMPYVSVFINTYFWYKYVALIKRWYQTKLFSVYLFHWP